MKKTKKKAKMRMKKMGQDNEAEEFNDNFNISNVSVLERVMNEATLRYNLSFDMIFIPSKIERIDQFHYSK